MKNRPAARDVDDDLAVSDHLLQHLRVGEVPGDAVPDVEDEVLDLLTVSFVDGGVKLRAKLRFLGALLKGLRDDQAQSNPVGILATVVILRFKRHAVLLLPIADPADEHGAVVGFVPPAGTFMDRAPHGRHFPPRRASSRQRLRIRNTSTISSKSSDDNSEGSSAAWVAQSASLPGLDGSTSRPADLRSKTRALASGRSALLSVPARPA